MARPETAHIFRLMADPRDLTALDAEELAALITRQVFDLNVTLRLASLSGVTPLDVDVVDRTNDAHPGGYPEIRVRAGEVQWPT